MPMVNACSINEIIIHRLYMKKMIKIISTVLLLTVLLLASYSEKNTCVKKNCSDFSSRAAAQSAYSSDPNCYNNLDEDDDGVACEHLY